MERHLWCCWVVKFTARIFRNYKSCISSKIWHCEKKTNQYNTSHFCTNNYNIYFDGKRMVEIYIFLNVVHEYCTFLHNRRDGGAGEQRVQAPRGEHPAQGHLQGEGHHSVQYTLAQCIQWPHKQCLKWHYKQCTRWTVHIDTVHNVHHSETVGAILRNCWRHLHHHAALLKGHPLCISEKKKEKKFTMTLQMQCTQ